jgi:hypothetical protein
MRVALVGATDSIRLPRMTTVMSLFAEPLRTSTTVTWASAVWAKPAEHVKKVWASAKKAEITRSNTAAPAYHRFSRRLSRPDCFGLGSLCRGGLNGTGRSKTLQRLLGPRHLAAQSVCRSSGTRRPWLKVARKRTRTKRKSVQHEVATEPFNIGRYLATARYFLAADSL